MPVKLIQERQTNVALSVHCRSWRTILGACLWIGGGGGALLLLCALGPPLVAYATSAGLPILVLAPLVSSVIAGWDVGGLLLIMIGIRRLMIAWSLRHER
jgi:hypothetical protein